MLYDVELANRLRDRFGDEDGITEKAMFGGCAFLLRGNMIVSAFSRGGLRSEWDRTPWTMRSPTRTLSRSRCGDGR